MAYIETIQPEQARGELNTIYQQLFKSRGKVAEVHKIQSLNPTAITRHMELYLHIMFGKSPLKRYQREMLGVITSKYNRCDYCVAHHSEALLHFWKDVDRLKRLIDDHQTANLDAADMALCNYAQDLTIHPDNISDSYIRENLKSAHWDDRAILDAAQVIAYFNFVNRLVLGLGVEIESDGGTGYNYD